MTRHLSSLLKGSNTPVHVSNLGAATETTRLAHEVDLQIAVEALQPDRAMDGETPDLGPQLPGERGLPQRMRLHQSWWRSEVLGLRSWGRLPRGGRALGSILADEDAAAGHNFLAAEARAVYESRRLEGWGVDPQRCTSNLMSSQTLTFNLLGPISSDPDWGVAVIRALTGVAVEELVKVAFEYAPARPSQHLDDQTRMDCLVVYRDVRGLHGAMAIETKLSDRFSSRRLPIASNARYIALTRALGIWEDAALSGASAANQLMRCHALAGSIGLRENLSLKPALWLIHHPDDSSADSVVGLYRSTLRAPETFITSTIAEVGASLATHAKTESHRRWAGQLIERYGSLSGSEHLLQTA